ncbi:hypothetical protein Tco_0899675 [Tanacetum coccineum]
MAEQDIPPPTITAMKIHIIRKGEYDIWSMRMRQYIYHTDHNLWDVIVNRDLEEEPVPTGETSAPPAPKKLAARRNQERVKSILLLAIPNEYILKVYEDELKRSPGSNSASQNLAFLSSRNTSSTNEVSTANGDFRVSTVGEINQVPSTLSAHDMNGDDLEELDLRWQVAMLTIRVTLLENADLEGIKGEDLMVTMAGAMHQQMNLHHRHCSSSSSDSEVQKCSKQCLESFKTLQKNYDTEREKHNKAKLEIKVYEIALESLESRILGHEKNELAWGEKYEFQNYELKFREIKINNLNLELEKVVKERDELKLKIEKWEESSKNLDELLNRQMSARDKTGLGYGIQLNEMSNNSETDSEISLSIFDVRSSDEESTPANDRSSKADGYHVVPPPMTGNFLTPRADISFAGCCDIQIIDDFGSFYTTDCSYDAQDENSLENIEAAE